MNLIIDGYNLLKQVFPGQKNTLDRHKNLFIQHLAYYKKQKPDLRDIIVVFDAGPSTHATRMVKSGIVIIYSGSRMTADDWIVQYVEQHKNTELLVITMDRELRKLCEKYDVEALDVYQFYALLQNTLIERGMPAPASQQTTIYKKYDSIPIDEFDSSDTIDKHAVDLLMEQASLQAPHVKKDDDQPARPPMKKKSYTPSKNERRLQSKLKKL